MNHHSNIGEGKKDEGATEKKNNLPKKKIHLRSTLLINIRPFSYIQFSSYANLSKNEPDPVTRPSSFPPVIVKGKGKVDDLYNSAVHAFVTGSQISEHNIPSPECGVACVPVDTRFHSLAVSVSLQQQNHNNNNVHVHDVAGEVASSSVAAENDYLFRPEVRQGVERQCFTGHVDQGVDVDPPVSAACLRRHLNANFGTLNEAPSEEREQMRTAIFNELCKMFDPEKGSFTTKKSKPCVVMFVFYKLKQNATKAKIPFYARYHPKAKKKKHDLAIVKDTFFSPASYAVLITGANDGYVTIWNAPSKKDAEPNNLYIMGDTIRKSIQCFCGSTSTNRSVLGWI